MTYKVYGIKNCDTVKKVLSALDKKKINYEFVDFKKCPPTKTLLNSWEEFLGTLPINPKGPTFRKIKDSFDQANKAQKISLLIENSSAIKRPLVEKNGKPLFLGLDQDAINLLK